MVKLRLFFVAIFLCGLGLTPAWAQTLNYADNSRNNRASERVVVSPEARAEAKRLYKEGVKYGVAHLFAQAAEMFERAVRLDPQNADAHFALGHAYFDMKQWKKAVGSFERAVELDPKDQQAVDYLALSRTMAHGEPPPGFKRTETAPQTQPQVRPKSVQVSMSVKPSSPPPAKSESAPPVKTEPATPKTEPPASEVNEVAEVPEVANAAANEVSLTKIYRVGPNDVLDIRINDSASPESRLFTVTPSGFIAHSN